MIIRYSVAFLLCFIFQFTFSQSKVKLKIYDQKIERGYQILADNDEFCPVSVKINFKLNNLESSIGNNNIIVVPPKTKGFKVTKLSVIKRGRYGYSYQTKYNLGNYHIKEVNNSFAYNLPFQKQQTFKLWQGYNGKTTHKGKNALDFTMKIGTPIHAVRSGTVVDVIENNDKNCNSKECAKYNNKVVVYHKDGTFAAYVHLQKDGVLVKEGDEIKAGQLIAKSGNTGWSSGPHLHFEVYLPKVNGRTLLKTKFKINKGTESKYLQEKESYVRNYE